MKKYLQCVLAIALMAISLNAASQSGAPAVANWTKSSTEGRLVAYTSGPCSITILRTGDLVIVADKEKVTQVITVLGGVAHTFWITRNGSPSVEVFGPNYLGDCPFERLPLEVQKKVDVWRPLLAKK